MLGYWDVGQPTFGSHFGAVNDTFAMDDVRCRGDEATIFACSHRTQDNCGVNRGAGVICEGLSKKTDFIPLSCYISQLPNSTIFVTVHWVFALIV